MLHLEADVAGAAQDVVAGDRLAGGAGGLVGGGGWRRGPGRGWASAGGRRRRRCAAAVAPARPRTVKGQEYLLIRREVHEKVRGFLKPFGRAWDNPADDHLIREDA